MKKVTLNGSLIIEHYYLAYYINQNADGTFHVEAAYTDTYTHGEGAIYKTEKSITTFDNVLKWIRETERNY